MATIKVVIGLHSRRIVYYQYFTVLVTTKSNSKAVAPGNCDVSTQTQDRDSVIIDES